MKYIYARNTMILISEKHNNGKKDLNRWNNYKVVKHDLVTSMHSLK